MRVRHSAVYCITSWLPPFKVVLTDYAKMTRTDELLDPSCYAAVLRIIHTHTELCSYCAIDRFQYVFYEYVTSLRYLTLET